LPSVDNRLVSGAFLDVVGSSQVLARLLDAAARLADEDVTVLIRGETHLDNHRSKQPLVVFDSACSVTSVVRSPVRSLRTFRE